MRKKAFRSSINKKEGSIMSEQEKSFLEIVDLKKSFGSGDTKQDVLRGMNFSVAKGEFCVLLGPSGSGKSTLLNIIGGIDSADSGYISINGDKLKDLGEKRLTQYRRPSSRLCVSAVQFNRKSQCEGKYRGGCISVG